MFVSLTAATLAAVQASSVPDVATIIARMEQARIANRASYRPYRVLRDYKFFGSDPEKVNAQVLAEVDFQPPNEKTYVIREARGNERGEKLVRKMLDHERSVSHEHSDVELSAQNYDFVFLRQEPRDGAMCYVVQLIPKRKEKGLLKGAIWVDANTYLIHHIEGELAKTPSFWLKEVRLSMDFSRVAGMWLCTTTEAVASVRFFGKHSMLERDVKFETAPAIAASSQQKPARMTNAGRTILNTPAIAGVGLRR
jgi:hypothetical protein